METPVWHYIDLAEKDGKWLLCNFLDGDEERCKVARVRSMPCEYRSGKCRMAWRSRLQARKAGRNSSAVRLLPLLPATDNMRQVLHAEREFINVTKLRTPGPCASTLTVPELAWSKHASSQEHVFQLLAAVWDPQRPRIMVDLGASRGIGNPQRDSDSGRWLRHFNASGGVVVVVDVVNSYLQDVASWLSRIPAPGVEVIALNNFIANSSGSIVDFAVLQRAADAGCECFITGHKLAALLNTQKKAAVIRCTGRECTLEDGSQTTFAVKSQSCLWETAERKGLTDHLCRIPRQRLGLNPSTLPYVNCVLRHAHRAYAEVLNPTMLPLSCDLPLVLRPQTQLLTCLCSG